MDKTLNTAKTPPKRKSRVNPDKARAYLKEYTSNGFNKTAAHNKINPRATYRSNNVNSNRLHKSIPSTIMNDSEFSLSMITPEYVIKRITRILNKPLTKDSDRLRASELLGDFIKIWSDKGITINQHSLTIPELQAFQGLRRKDNLTHENKKAVKLNRGTTLNAHYRTLEGKAPIDEKGGGI